MNRAHTNSSAVRRTIMTLALALAGAPFALAAVGQAGCGSSQVPPAEVPPLEEGTGQEADGQTAEAPRQPPPPPGQPKEVRFPDVSEASLDNGLALNTAQWDRLPVVYLHLVVKSGAETIDRDHAGMASVVADMLKEGTRRKSSAQLAEAVDVLGADLSTYADEENVHVVFRALSDQLDEAMDLLAEVAMQPRFDRRELQKLQRRELARLRVMATRDGWLAHRESEQRLYGDHPYGTYDTTPEALEKMSVADLRRWHGSHFVPGNAFLVAVGNVASDDVKTAAERAFGRWRGRTPEAPTYPEPPVRESREIVIVDRPGSVQSQIRIGNVAVPRSADDWVALEVGNQVLGGGISSRLFMDLRERRSLTYGAYSFVSEEVDDGVFIAGGSVRTEVTTEAIGAFMEHLQKIVAESPSAEEMQTAKRYLSDSFPLAIDTPGKIAARIADLRIYDLPEGYWDGYPTQVRAVTPAQAHAALRAHLHPERALIVIVGEAAAFAEDLRRWGAVTIVSTDGEVKQRLDAAGAGGGSEAATPSE